MEQTEKSNKPKISHLENMVGEILHSIQVIQVVKDFAELTNFYEVSHLSWWNSIPFPLINSGLFCSNKSFKLSSLC